MDTTTRPAWWPTPEHKLHADAGCAHPDECKVAQPPAEQATVTLAFSPMTRRGLAYWQRDLDDELARAARLLIDCLEDDGMRKYINEREGDHLRRVNATWLVVLDAREQRRSTDDALDATNERPYWADWI